MKKIFLFIIGALLSFSLAQAQCTAIFDYSYTGTSYVIEFTDISTGTTGGRHFTHWDFNDGTTDGGSSVTHTFNSAGNFYVCMDIYDSLSGCYERTCKYVNVPGSGAGCYANFTYTMDSLVEGKIYFDNISSGASGYYWDFGDGASSTDSDPVHTFAADSFYHVILFALDTNRMTCDSIVQTVYIPKNRDKCLASFIAQPDVTDYRKIYFTNLGIAQSFVWDFGDGNTSTASNPSHTYSLDSIFFVKLIALDDAGMPCDSIIQPLYIDSSGRTCNADFMMSNPSRTSSGYSVYFVNLTNTTRMGFYWTFGDGTSSSQANPTHVYANAGPYTVTLYVSQSSGAICDSMSQILYIDTSCHASFYFARDTSSTFMLYLINNSYNVSRSTSFYWDFGDGSTYTTPNPTHTYSNFGRYQVCLTIRDSSAGCFSTFCDSIGMDSNGNILKKDGFSIMVLDESQLLSTSELHVAETRVKLYPNPSEGKANLLVQANRPEEYSVFIYNIQGRLVKEFGFNALTGENKIECDLRDQAKGLYFITLRSESLNKSIKLMYR